MVRERFGVDEDVCTGDHACIRLSGCPSLSLKHTDDPLKDDPVAAIDNNCVGCGNCGEVSEAAVLCPSFYRADIIRPTWFDRFMAECGVRRSPSCSGGARRRASLSQTDADRAIMNDLSGTLVTPTRYTTERPICVGRFRELRNSAFVYKGKPINAQSVANELGVPYVVEAGFRLVGGHASSDGRRLGTARLASISTAIVDALYEKLLVVKETDASGNTVERERRTTINHAMKSCRRAWNIAARRNPGKVPLVNPFAAMGLEGSDRQTPTATFGELSAFRAKAVEMGLGLARYRRPDRMGVVAEGDRHILRLRS